MEREAARIGRVTSTQQTEFHAWAARPRPGWDSFDAGDWAAAGPRDFSDPFVDAADSSAGDSSVIAGQGSTIRYQTSTWTSPWHPLDSPAQEIIVSFNATTPGHSWIEVQIQVSTDQGTRSRWFTMARWCQKLPDPYHPGWGGAINRASIDGQSDPCARVDTDTLIAADGQALTGYRLRAVLMHPDGAPERPRITLLGAAAGPDHTAGPDDTAGADSPAGSDGVSPAGPAAGLELAVRPLSQMVHRGTAPQYGGGGESWCSPTSVAMAMGFHGVIEPVDAVVPETALGTWDHQYRGAGNWAFSAAHAAAHGLEAFVTRLPDLRALEEFIVLGLPVVVSVSFRATDLDGAGYSTDGHLMLVIGFTDDGDVVVDDPASHEEPSDDRVRTVYRRDQLEEVWLAGSGGVVYVIAPPGSPLPPTRSRDHRRSP